MRRGGKIAGALFLLYAGGIMPRMRKKPKQPGEIYYAHRGLYDNEGEAPENSLPAFRRAVSAGCGIELDVQLTRDGEAVVFHDFDLKRACRVEKEVEQLTYQELRQYSLFQSEERIPLLSDVLKIVKGKAPLLIELKYKKGSGVCRKTDEVLRDYPGEYMIESFHPQVLYWYRRHRPFVARGQLSMNYQREKGWYKPGCFIMRFLLLNFITKPDFIAYDYRDGRNLSLRLCRGLFHCPAYGWTIKSEQALQKCKREFDRYIFEGFIPEEIKK